MKFSADGGFSLALAAWLSANYAAFRIALGTPSLRAYAFVVGLIVILLASIVRSVRKPKKSKEV